MHSSAHGHAPFLRPALDLQPLPVGKPKPSRDLPQYLATSTHLKNVSTNFLRVSSSRTKLKNVGKSRPSSLPSSAFDLPLLAGSDALLSCGRKGTSLRGAAELFFHGPRQLAGLDDEGIIPFLREVLSLLPRPTLAARLVMCVKSMGARLK